MNYSNESLSPLNTNLRSYNEQLADKFYSNISRIIDVRLNDFSKSFKKIHKKRKIVKCNHLSKLTRLNELIDLNPKYKFSSNSSTCSSMTPSSIYPDQEQEPDNSHDQTINSTDELSSITQDPPIVPISDQTVINEEVLKDSIVPVLSLSSNQNNVTLVWSIMNELDQQILDKNHPIFQSISSYEIHGLKKLKIKCDPDAPEEVFDSSKWLPLGTIKHKTSPSQVSLKDFQKETWYFFSIRIRFSDNKLGKFSKTERICFD